MRSRDKNEAKLVKTTKKDRFLGLGERP